MTGGGGNQEARTSGFHHLVTTLGEPLLSLLFPRRCGGCGEVLPEARGFCGQCQAKLHWVGDPKCPGCGLPFAAASSWAHRCEACHRREYSFAAARASLVYEGLGRRLIQEFKYGKKLHLAPALASLMQDAAAGLAAEWQVEVLVPVPLHQLRLRQRGFNQAALLATHLGRQLNLAVDYASLERRRWTEPQAGLSRRGRQRNLSRAFSLQGSHRLRQRRVMLVDDVFTTGVTVEQCSRAVLRGGAAAVVVVTTARTVAWAASTGDE